MVMLMIMTAKADARSDPCEFLCTPGFCFWMPRWHSGYALKKGRPRSLEALTEAPHSILIMMNADHYMNNLLPKLIEDCDNLMPHNFIFQQDDAQTHTTFGTGLNRTAKSRLHTKINGHLTHQISILLTFMSGEPCCKSTRPTSRNQKTKRNWRRCFKRSWTTFLKRKVLLAFRLQACTRTHGVISSISLAVIIISITIVNRSCLGPS